ASPFHQYLNRLVTVLPNKAIGADHCFDDLLQLLWLLLDDAIRCPQPDMRKLQKIVGTGKHVETRAARLSIRRWSNQRRIDQTFLQGRQTGTVKAEGDNLHILVWVDA